MPVIDQCLTDKFAIYHADCMEVLPSLQDGSVGLSVYSPPFPELYQYSDDPRDMTNCTNYQESIDQYRFVVEQIARLTVPGRMSCVHCTDLRHGAMYQRDFPGDIIRIHEEVGMRFFCRVTIWKDPWEFARRTRMKSLMHKQVTVIDSAGSRIAPADYLLVFKKAGVNPTPITRPQGFREYIGGRQIPPDLLRDYGSFVGDPRANLLSHWIWRQYASPVWLDIRRGRLLPYAQARECVEEKHVCPLQLDVIDRCLELWSKAGETVLSPFMGVGSEVYEAVLFGRRGIGVELKATYYRQALRSIEHGAEHGTAVDIVPAVDELDEAVGDELEGDEEEVASDQLPVASDEEFTTEGAEVTEVDESNGPPATSVNGVGMKAGLEPEVDGIDDASRTRTPSNLSASVPSVSSVVNPSQCDELFDQAKAIVLKEGRGSVALVQRKLAIGYGRATRLIDQLVAAGVVGAFVGTSNCRNVIDPSAVAEAAAGVAVPAAVLAGRVDGNYACGRAMQPLRPEEM